MSKITLLFACCKGQIIVHTSEVDGSEPEPEIQDDKKIYDPRLVWPYSLLLCGPTGCGKTTWLEELLKYHEELCTHTPKKLFGFMESNNQTFLKPLGKFGSLASVNLLMGVLKICLPA